MLATAGAGPARPAASSATTTLVSVSTSGEQSNYYSWAIGISANGRFAVFSSEASNLVPHDTNKQSDVFVRDRLAGTTTRVSVTSSGGEAHQSPHEFGGSREGGISANGRYVVFVSDATNLVPRDTNRLFDVFVHDRVSGKTQRVSVSSAGRQGNGSSGEPAISADGRFVVFMSTASNLVARDSNRQWDMFVHDRVTGKTQRVSVSSAGRQANGESDVAAISTHGRYVAFSSLASNLVPRDTNHNEDIFVRDRRTGKTQRVSVSSSGKQSKGRRGVSDSVAPVISGNGRYVAFKSAASNLVPHDTNRVGDMFVHDRLTGKTQRVSVSSTGAQANGDVGSLPAISADGRYVVFGSFASNLVPGDSNGAGDVFVHDRVTHLTLLASLSSSGEQGNDTSYAEAGALSADNRYLVFSSWAHTLAPDTNPNPDVFVRDFGAPLGTRASPRSRAGLSAGSAVAVAQLEFPPPLVAPGDRVEIGYDTRTTPAAKGFLYVRNDTQRAFTRIALRRRKASQQLVPSDRFRVLRATVPASVVRGHKLFYYSVLRLGKGRSLRIPAVSSEKAWVLTGARIVRLGTHRFGRLRAPGTVVAKAGPGQVAFTNPAQGAKEGPWSFEVARDRSIWLLDELNRRLLVWPPGHPKAHPRVVKLASILPIDFALGPAGSVYITRGLKPPVRAMGLTRLAAGGRVLWTSKLATGIFNNQLRQGPDATLYWTGGVPSSRRTERGGPDSVWVPAATPHGKPLSTARQARARTMYQPLRGGLRLLCGWAPFEKDPFFGRAPHEERFALINRAGRLVRSWRITSRTVIWPHPQATPALVGHDLVVVLTASSGRRNEYLVLRLAKTPSGTRARFSLPSASWLDTSGRAAWGDVMTDLRVGPDGKLYQLGSSPTTGVAIYRYSMAAAA
ncbi:MAG TPA: hypothetical protein VEG40_03860 [Gaiellaceae bacterium]|nr:hypothetical protein [Gaiellaceae bacterium]